MGVAIIHFVALNLITGVFVAGIDAGKVYNTWPWMGDELIPSRYF